MSEGPKIDRLYDLLPVVYRQRDVELGKPLRALLQVISEQVNVVEADIAQLYNNLFIETCEDWAVPYIADLIGYRIVHEAGEPGGGTTPETEQRNKILIPRREVANTIRYRRRKGTLALLELLASDVAGWPARAAEFYQILLASQNINHLQLSRAQTVDLRQGDALDRVEGALDECAHTVSVRRINSRYAIGRPGITNTGLFIWRLKAYSVTRAPAFCLDRVRHHYTFSMLGNNTQLFTKAVAEPDPTHVADEMNVPAPIRRRALEERAADYYGKEKSLCIWRDDPLRVPKPGQAKESRIPLEQIVVADLSHWAYRPQGDQVALDPKLGRISFSQRGAPKTGVWVTYHYGFSADIGGGEYERHLRPSNALTREPDSPPPPSAGSDRYIYRVSQQQPGEHYFRSINSALKAWGEDRPEEAIVQIEDSDAYVEQISIILDYDQRLELRAANGTRPVIRLLDWYTNRPDSMGILGPAQSPTEPEEPVEESADSDPDKPHQEEQTQPNRSPAEGGEPCAPHPRMPRITLDGLLIAGRGVQVSGDLAEVLIRHCTLVPGWSLDHKCNPEYETEPSLELTDTGAQLTIEHSILGSIQIHENEVATDPITIQISDSILDATSMDLNALSDADNAFAHAQLGIVRSTIFGQVRTHSIRLAEDSLFNGLVTVVRSQIGCVRFCHVEPGSRTPRRYHCQPDLAEAAAAEELRAAAREANAPPPGQNEIETAQRPERKRVRPRFNSVRYGTPMYCQLAETCAAEIKRGANDESEMGAFHDLFQPQREANLRARLDEYTPAGMDAGLIFVT